VLKRLNRVSSSRDNAEVDTTFVEFS
jgi:hypothetical protein